ncbi:hypothetical protein BC831DRAFT_445754, partial [Entophlyctis helioformis]
MPYSSHSKPPRLPGMPLLKTPFRTPLRTLLKTPHCRPSRTTPWTTPWTPLRMSLLPPQLSSGPRHSFCWPPMAAHPRGKGTRLLPLSPQMPRRHTTSRTGQGRHRDPTRAESNSGDCAQHVNIGHWTVLPTPQARWHFG